MTIIIHSLWLTFEYLIESNDESDQIIWNFRAFQWKTPCSRYSGVYYNKTYKDKWYVGIIGWYDERFWPGKAVENEIFCWKVLSELKKQIWTFQVLCLFNTVKSIEYQRCSDQSNQQLEFKRETITTFKNISLYTWFEYVHDWWNNGKVLYLDPSLI